MKSSFLYIQGFNISVKLKWLREVMITMAANISCAKYYKFASLFLPLHFVDIFITAINFCLDNN